jgi:hypothetical protein
MELTAATTMKTVMEIEMATGMMVAAVGRTIATGTGTVMATEVEQLMAMDTGAAMGPTKTSYSPWYHNLWGTTTTTGRTVELADLCNRKTYS